VSDYSSEQPIEQHQDERAASVLVKISISASKGDDNVTSHLVIGAELVSCQQQ
jgi:hypothetical protein